MVKIKIKTHTHITMVLFYLIGDVPCNDKLYPNVELACQLKHQTQKTSFIKKINRINTLISLSSFKYKVPIPVTVLWCNHVTVAVLAVSQS